MEQIEKEPVPNRDYIAIEAMKVILPIFTRMGRNLYPGQPNVDWETKSGEPHAIAELSYTMADAMLKARKETKTE